MDTLPNPAGCLRFDELLGTHFFTGMYGRSADIFGAIPSLHVAYPLQAVFYAFRFRSLRAFSVVFYVVMCFSAIYLNHHYVLDLISGERLPGSLSVLGYGLEMGARKQEQPQEPFARSRITQAFDPIVVEYFSLIFETGLFVRGFPGFILGPYIAVFVPIFIVLRSDERMRAETTWHIPFIQGSRYARNRHILHCWVRLEEIAHQLLEQVSFSFLGLFQE